MNLLDFFLKKYIIIDIDAKQVRNNMFTTSEFDFNLQNSYENIFTNDVKLAVASAVVDAYTLRQQFYQTTTLLLTSELAIDVSAHILRIALEKVFRKYCKNGRLPWCFNTQLNVAKNCRHIELKIGNATIFLARSSCPFKKPKKVKYRPDLEYDMYTETFPPITTFLIAYGEYKNGTPFVTIGIPGIDDWLYAHPLDLTAVKPQSNAKTSTSKYESKDLLVELRDEVKRLTKEGYNENAG
jgi:hypothetical protein